MPSPTKEKIVINTKRENGTTTFNFQVPAKLTAILKSQAEEVRESSNWSGHTFYYLPQVVESEKYKSLLRSYNLFDNYGSTLIKNDDRRSGEFMLNIAWLRTVGGAGSITISDTVSLGELTRMTQDVTSFLKDYFQDYFSDFSITGEITFQVN